MGGQEGVQVGKASLHSPADGTTPSCWDHTLLASQEEKSSVPGWGGGTSLSLPQGGITTSF